MKSVKFILGIPAAALLIFLFGNVFISQKFHVERTVFVEVSDTTAFKYAANYNLNNTWNPYFKKEPSAIYSITGKPGTGGYSFSLKGKEQGDVKVEFINTYPYKAIYQKVTLKSSMNGTYENNIYFNRAYKGTFVTWTFAGTSKNILEKWASLFYDDTIGEEFQSGLDNLKEELEKEQFSHFAPPKKSPAVVQVSKL
jgi:hypothetical protein